MMIKKKRKKKKKEKKKTEEEETVLSIRLPFISTANDFLDARLVGIGITHRRQLQQQSAEAEHLIEGSSM